MAIVKMKKFRLFALEKDRKPLLKELQKFDYVHFIKELSSILTIPIFAIGGINEENSNLVLNSGAFGVCMMSSLMKY